MRTGIHPVYAAAKVVCACGNTFETRSTKEIIRLEICSACHPFFTGQQKLIDSAGRVERFQKRFETTGGKTIVRKPIKSSVRKLVSVGSAVKRKVLTSAPKKESKTAAKKPKKTA